MKPEETGATKRNVLGAIWTLIRTDFMVRYHGTIMGFMWALLRPIAMLIVLFSVFSFLFGTTKEYAINLVIGLFLYDYFQEATKWGLISLHNKGFLLKKSNFPRWILVLTPTVNPLITLLIAGIGINICLLATGHSISPLRFLLFFFYVAHLVLMVCGFSLAASVCFVRYRDLNQVWEVVAQAGFFVAPVIFPLKIIPEQYHIYLYFWPPTSVIEFSRSVLTGEVLPTLKGQLLLSAMTVVCLFFGIFVYRLLVKRAAEYL
ncbi:MAG: ABC transporter permease [Pseudomonadota bacterium]